MAGHYAEAPGHLVAVISLEILVERKVVAADAAANHRGVGREDGGDGYAGVLYVKEAGSGLPLVELRHHLVGGVEVETVEAGDHAPGGIAEQGGLLVIPVAADGIDAETLPILREDLVLFGKELLVVYEYGHRLAGDVPASDTDTDTLLGCLDFPVAVQRGILDEIGIVLGMHPHIRTDHDMASPEHGLLVKGLGGDHRIDPAYLVADFPADFEQVVGAQ